MAIIPVTRGTTGRSEGRGHPWLLPSKFSTSLGYQGLCHLKEQREGNLPSKSRLPSSAHISWCSTPASPSLLPHWPFSLPLSCWNQKRQKGKYDFCPKSEGCDFIGLFTPPKQTCYVSTDAYITTTTAHFVLPKRIILGCYFATSNKSILFCINFSSQGFEHSCPEVSFSS